MNSGKTFLTTLGFALSVSFIASAISALLTSHYCSKQQFNMLNIICSEIIAQEPEAEKTISAVLKEYVLASASPKKKSPAPSKEYLNNYTNKYAGNTAATDILSASGYHISDFTPPAYGRHAIFVTAGFLTGIFLFILTFLHRNRTESRRIQALTEYLELVNTGKAVILSASGEDDFSKLEDEIYKTVTSLYQTKDSAIQARNDFAENLSNIAHQLKTPITAISLSAQTMLKEYDKKLPEQILKQILRLTRLEEALLILARLDTGTLLLQKKKTDVFTILVLAADNLQELFTESGTAIDIPELGEMAVKADLDWTMEAVMNLMKNCMEHNTGGTVHCSYGQNPLYTEILIWDEGAGFCKEDIPRLFERFYRGRNACESGIGIGLALSKEIIERQNGTIRAKNMPDGGACFEIRFYSH